MLASSKCAAGRCADGYASTWSTFAPNVSSPSGSNAAQRMPTPSRRSDKQEPHVVAIKLLAHHVQARVIGFAGTAALWSPAPPSAGGGSPACCAKPLHGGSCP